MRSGVEPTRTEADVLGLPEVSMVELFSMSPADRAEYTRLKRDAFKVRKRDELVEELQSAGLGAEAIVAPHERLDHKQLRATGSVVEVDDPEMGLTIQLGMTLFLE